MFSLQALNYICAMYCYVAHLCVAFRHLSATTKEQHEQSKYVDNHLPKYQSNLIIRKFTLPTLSPHSSLVTHLYHGHPPSPPSSLIPCLLILHAPASTSSVASPQTAYPLGDCKIPSFEILLGSTHWGKKSNNPNINLGY